MTGEMHKSEVTKEAFPLHFKLAKKYGGTVRPFDQYQGRTYSFQASAACG